MCCSRRLQRTGHLKLPFYYGISDQRRARNSCPRWNLTIRVPNIDTDQRKALRERAKKQRYIIENTEVIHQLM